MKLIIFLVLFSSNLFAQSYFNFYSILNYKNHIDIDSVFQQYEAPEISDSLKYPYYEWNELYVLIYFKSDTVGNVQNLRIFPLSGIPNDEEIENTIWESIVKEIIEKSKKWKLKPVYWKYEGIIPEVEKIAKDYNSKPSLRPFDGSPDFILILHYYNGPGIFDIPFLNFINVY